MRHHFLIAGCVTLGTFCAARAQEMTRTPHAAYSEPKNPLAEAFYSGDFNRSRALLEARRVEEQRKDGINNMLHQLRLTLVNLADGYSSPQDAAVGEVFNVLRTQGINADKTVDVVVNNGRNTYWKGDPFEQALAFHYLGVHFAMQGSWDNARAAETGSLFPLRDYSKGASGPGQPGGYVVRETNFALGYLMTAIANHQLSLENGDDNRRKEADDYYAKAAQHDANIAGLVRQLRDGKYNTLLVVDFGRGPRKIAFGVDQEQLKYKLSVPSTDDKLIVTVGGRPDRFPQVCDLNVMASDNMWNPDEGWRITKAVVSKFFLMSGGEADARYCEMMPQRVYVAPLQVDSPRSKVEVEMENFPMSRLVLAGLSPPAGKAAQLRYVRLVSWGGGAPAWTRLGVVFYANDYSPATVGAPKAPYILGGTDVRTPSDAVLKSYQSRGVLTGMTLEELIDLYRREGIAMTLQDQGGLPRPHVLEGGKSLVSPLPGSAGFERLYCQYHPAYKPSSRECQEWFAKVTQQLRAKAPSPP